MSYDRSCGCRLFLSESNNSGGELFWVAQPFQTVLLWQAGNIERDGLSLEPSTFPKRCSEHNSHRQWWTTGDTERREWIHKFSPIWLQSLNDGGHSGIGPIVTWQGLQRICMMPTGTRQTTKQWHSISVKYVNDYKSDLTMTGWTKRWKQLREANNARVPFLRQCGNNGLLRVTESALFCQQSRLKVTTRQHMIHQTDASLSLPVGRCPALSI